MEFLLISRSELRQIKKLYETILGVSSEGLFYSVGQIVGKSIANTIKDRENFFENATKILKERNYVSDISFEDYTITAGGSIEIGRRGDKPDCHILRGILVALYEVYYDKKLYCEEISCGSIGKNKCTFRIESEVI